jgi:hypothetical protein
MPCAFVIAERDQYTGFLGHWYLGFVTKLFNTGWVSGIRGQGSAAGGEACLARKNTDKPDCGSRPLVTTRFARPPPFWRLGFCDNTRRPKVKTYTLCPKVNPYTQRQKVKTYFLAV